MVCLVWNWCKLVPEVGSDAGLDGPAMRMGKCDE